MKNTYIIENRVKFVLSEKSLERVTDGYKVKLRTPASFCLQLLLENQGKLITHDELYYSGWERFGMTATLSVLHNTIYYLRKVLHETGEFDNKIIETINRRGFVFSLQVNIVAVILNPEGQKSESDAASKNPLGTNEKNIEGSFPEDTTVYISSLMEKDLDKESDLNIDEETKPDYFYRKEWQNLKHENCNQLVNKVNMDFDNFISQDEKKTFSLIEKLNALSLNINLKITLSFVSVIILLYLCKIMLKDSFPGTYTFTGNLEKCEVYQNNTSYDFKKLKATEYLKKYCQTNRSLYLTFYPYTNKLSSLNCREKISFISDDICYSNYFIFNNDGLNDV